MKRNLITAAAYFICCYLSVKLIENAFLASILSSIIPFSIITVYDLWRMKKEKEDLSKKDVPKFVPDTWKEGDVLKIKKECIPLVDVELDSNKFAVTVKAVSIEKDFFIVESYNFSTTKLYKLPASDINLFHNQTESLRAEQEKQMKIREQVMEIKQINDEIKKYKLQ